MEAEVVRHINEHFTSVENYFKVECDYVWPYSVDVKYIALLCELTHDMWPEKNLKVTPQVTSDIAKYSEEIDVLQGYMSNYSDDVYEYNLHCRGQRKWNPFRTIPAIAC